MNPLEYWNPEEFEISSYKYSLKERVNKTYTTSGSDNTNLCTYTYNELGFSARGDVYLEDDIDHIQMFLLKN
jgi:predicted GNAT family N-acyltransferase